jgi:hypothetical protein
MMIMITRTTRQRRWWCWHQSWKWTTFSHVSSLVRTIKLCSCNTPCTPRYQNVNRYLTYLCTVEILQQLFCIDLPLSRASSKRVPEIAISVPLERPPSASTSTSWKTCRSYLSVSRQVLPLMGTSALPNTQWHTTVGMISLGRGSARRRDLYLATHYTQKRKTTMPPAGFETTIPASKRSQIFPSPYTSWPQGSATEFINGTKYLK